MNNVELRLRCVELATERAQLPADIMARADMILKWVTEESKPEVQHHQNTGNGHQKNDHHKRTDTSRVLP